MLSKILLEKLAISTYANYLGFLGELGNQFGIPTQKELEKFEEIFKKLSQK